MDEVIGGGALRVVNKRQIRFDIGVIKRVETWKLVIVLILLAFIAATFLRLNNIGMADRRQAVYAADKSGNTAAIESRLYDLQRFSNAHMNAESGDVYLQQQYNRDVEAAAKKAQESVNPNNNINAEVNRICQDKVSGYGPAWIQCFTEELAKYPAAPDLASTITLPNPNLYRYAFAAPLWSPDFAGWSIIACIIIILVIVIRIVSLIVLRLLVRRHYRGV